jgi:hypothetical protein
MRGQLQGVQSTQKEQPVQDECNNGKIEKKQEFMVLIHQQFNNLN